MKYVFILSVLINVAYAQTGIKTTPPTKRVMICCGKATNVTTTPTTTNQTNPTKPNKVKTL